MLRTTGSQKAETASVLKDTSITQNDRATSNYGSGAVYSLIFTPQPLESTKPEPSQRCSALQRYKLVASA